MGNRVSVQFVQYWKKSKYKGYAGWDEKALARFSESVVLFSHWGGMDFVQKAKRFAKSLSVGNDPLGRQEPNTVMVAFIARLAKTDGVDSLYLGCTEGDGDNSDNGHFKIQLK